MNISPRSLSILWRITVIVALVLLLATVALALKSRDADDGELTGTVIGPGASIYLRVAPDDERRIVAILRPGATLVIKNSINQDNQTWYQVETESQSGWLPSTNVSFEHP